MKTFSDTTIREMDLNKFHEHLARLRGNPENDPEASVIVPVNAQGDLDKLLLLIGDIARYRGNHTFEVIAVINNYPPDNPPAQIETLSNIGIRVVDIPALRLLGENAAFSARVPGVRAASSNITIHFDADCRVPDSTALLNYYLCQLSSGVALAYTPVQFHDLPEGLSIRCRVVLHHTIRWMKRNLLRIPTSRGSNYAIDRSLMLQLVDTGRLVHDFQIGPNVKALGGRYAYSGARELTVLTSARAFHGGWARLFSYVRWRLRYNLRVSRDIAAARSVGKS